MYTTAHNVYQSILCSLNRINKEVVLINLLLGIIVVGNFKQKNVKSDT